MKFFRYLAGLLTLVIIVLAAYFGTFGQVAKHIDRQGYQLTGGTGGFSAYKISICNRYDKQSATQLSMNKKYVWDEKKISFKYPEHIQYINKTEDTVTINIPGSPPPLIITSEPLKLDREYMQVENCLPDRELNKLGMSREIRTSNKEGHFIYYSMSLTKLGDDKAPLYIYAKIHENDFKQSLIDTMDQIVSTIEVDMSSGTVTK